MLLTCVTCVEFRQDLTGHQHIRPPKRADASRSTRQLSIELGFGEVKPRMGGLSGNETKKIDKADLNVSRLSFIRIVAGMQFHSFGPSIPNDESAMD